jgi:hypothetical protein
MNEVEEIKSAINQCEPLGDKIVATIPTLHGYHLISKPFNKMRFRQFYNKELDVHDNNPTVLYICKSDN